MNSKHVFSVVFKAIFNNARNRIKINSEDMSLMVNTINSNFIYHSKPFIQK